ncbi:MAG: DUF2284 domain-containing protein [Defluviitaleaceae bacterium]|nr:DUF2284 domain-containing protein [Defluviitaleaceae bacterium]MCL2276197.1 DUF2284 domain-containing protein [Defluviitaleaceae bacterium]
MNAEKYIQQALSMGAKNAVRFQISDIVFDPRVVLKCIFGCSDYGRNHTCPYQKSPLTMKEYEEVFGRYQWGIIIGCADKPTSQKISYEVERQAFLDGYYFSFSLSDCGLCKECSKITDEPCRVPGRARPAFHAVGIDVFKTVHKFNLPLSVATDMEAELNWYSAVFFE